MQTRLVKVRPGLLVANADGPFLDFKDIWFPDSDEDESNKNNDYSAKDLEPGSAVKSWPFHLLSQVLYDSIFSTPLTISRECQSIKPRLSPALLAS